MLKSHTRGFPELQILWMISDVVTDLYLPDYAEQLQLITPSPSAYLAVSLSVRRGL